VEVDEGEEEEGEEGEEEPERNGWKLNEINTCTQIKRGEPGR